VNAYQLKNAAMMKNFGLSLMLFGIFIFMSCENNNDQSENFKLLTDPSWRSDSLLVNGFDASGPAGLLEDFKGDVKFNTDGTGTFGTYTGTWRFASNETQLVITADSLLFPLTTMIRELTKTSLKVTTNFPNPLNPTTQFNIRMTFKPK
jgi:hypothetical protein